MRAVCLSSVLLGDHGDGIAQVNVIVGIVLIFSSTTFGLPNSPRMHLSGCGGSFTAFHPTTDIEPVMQCQMTNTGTTPQQVHAFLNAGNEANNFSFINNSSFVFEAAEEFLKPSLSFCGTFCINGERARSMATCHFLTIKQVMANFNALAQCTFANNGPCPKSRFSFYCIWWQLVGGNFGHVCGWASHRIPTCVCGGHLPPSATPLKHVNAGTKENNMQATVHSRMSSV